MICRFFPAALLGLLCFAAGAQAQTSAPDCKLLQLAAIDLTPLSGDSRMLVPVTINGTPQKLLLGTSGGLITLNNTAAEALHMSTHQADVRILDANGFASRRYVRAGDFVVAGVHVRNRAFFLTPDATAGIVPPNDGLFDAGLRYHLDVEMDFANRKLNYFSPNHCEGRVVYWPSAPAEQEAVPLTMRQRLDNNARHGDVITNAGALGSLPEADTDFLLSLLAAGQGIAGDDIQIQVILDGEHFTANIDTALQYSTLNSVAARSVFAVTADSPGSAPVASLDDAAKATGQGESVTVYGVRAFAHTFHTLSFGGVTVTNPHFIVKPDRTGAYDPDNRFLTGSHIYKLDGNLEPDISIGMDVLSKLHLYFAFREQKLYVTPAMPRTASAGAAY